MTTYTQQQLENITSAIVFAVEDVVRNFDANSPEIKAAEAEWAKLGMTGWNPKDDLVIAMRKAADRAMFAAIDAMGLSAPPYTD